MAPPVGADLSRRVLPVGIIVDGQYLPEITMVSSTSWSLHYSDDYYPEPMKFSPERWIVGEAASTSKSVELAQSALYAFSTGPRGCVGKNMAWLQMRIVMAKAIRKYELQAGPKQQFWWRQSGGRLGLST
jgi:cytochrome P450